MHKYRTSARQMAWYDDPGDPPSYNPFRKINSRQRSGGDEESGSGRIRHRSENDIMHSMEMDRIAQSEDAYQRPNHASSMPVTRGPNGLSVPQNMARSPDMKDSEGSGAGTSETIVADEPQPEHPRRRNILDKLHRKRTVKPEVSRVASAGSETTRPKFTLMNQIKATIFNSWINILLIMAPVGIAVNYAGIDPVGVFVINFIAIIPLAAMLSYGTEEIALRTGETIGGLLNASFGNAVELIVSIIALVHNEVLIVQTSLIGSILSNLLLVMGMCFFFGGLNRVEQSFNVTVAQTASSLLALAVGSLIIPTAFVEFTIHPEDNARNIAPLSRGTCVLLLLVYGCYLFFQLKTHTAMYNEPSAKAPKRKVKVEDGDTSKGIAQIGVGMAGSMGTGGPNAEQTTMRDEPDEREQPRLSIWVAMATLAISTAFVGICAEFMVGSINALVDRGGISKTFVGLILLPIVGNAAEHATAVTVACKDKMDLAIGVAVGSSLQIALLVVPFVVVLGWILGNDAMTLQFDGFQIAIMFVAVLLVNYLIQDGKSHWLEGVLLMTLYIIIAIAAWYYPSNSESTG